MAFSHESFTSYIESSVATYLWQLVSRGKRRCTVDRQQVLAPAHHVVGEIDGFMNVLLLGLGTLRAWRRRWRVLQECSCQALSGQRWSALADKGRGGGSSTSG